MQHVCLDDGPKEIGSAQLQELIGLTEFGDQKLAVVVNNSGEGRCEEAKPTSRRSTIPAVSARHSLADCESIVADSSVTNR